MAITPRNEIEERQLAALKKFRHNPDEWTFEGQLPYYRQLSDTWNPDIEEFMERLSSWAPSRFELIELIPLYYLSSLDIQTAQKMSRDTTPLPYTPFVIASDPSHDIRAYVREHGAGITREVAEAIPYVVWVNVGIVNFTKLLAHHFAWTLVRNHGGLSQLFDAAASTQNQALLIELLRERRFKDDPDIIKALQDAPYPTEQTDRVSWLAPQFGNIYDLDRDIQAVVAVFSRVQTTFIIGHEMGHLYLGHIGSNPRTQILHRRSGKHPFSDLFAFEIEADMLGLLSIWDGYTYAKEGGSASIDDTWVVPLFFLATMLGFARATSEEENAKKWWYRLYFLCLALKRNLAKANFEPLRIQRIAYAAPAIVWATVEWVRLEPSDDPDSEEFDYTVLYELTDLFRHA